MQLHLQHPAGASIAGELALAALSEQSDEAAMAAIALGLIPGGKLLGGLGKIVSGIGGAAWAGAKHYAGKAGAKLGNFAGSLLDRAKWLHRKKALPSGNCPIRCFVAGTLVLTAIGPVPIESICAGDIALSWNEQTQQVEPNVVVDTVRVDAAAILDVTIGHENGDIETLGTTDDHPFYVTQRANGDGVQGWVQASQLNAGDTLLTRTGSAQLLDLSFTSRRETVYNLQVANASTYIAGGGGVVVHNCDVLMDMPKLRGGHHDHKWEKVFGHTKFSDVDLRRVVLHVLDKGAQRLDPKAIPAGWLFDSTLQIKGHIVKVRGILLNASNKIKINTAYVE